MHNDNNGLMDDVGRQLWLWQFSFWAPDDVRRILCAVGVAKLVVCWYVPTNIRVLTKLSVDKTKLSFLKYSLLMLCPLIKVESWVNSSGLVFFFQVKDFRNKGNLLHYAENSKFHISKSIGYPNSLYSMK